MNDTENRVSSDESLCHSTVNKDNSQGITHRRRKPGIVYLSTIPPSFNVLKLRQYFSRFGQVEKLLLQPIEDETIKRSHGRMGKRPQFSEGWIEFKSKRKAKMVHIFLNNRPVGGKKSNPDYDFLWNVKYLSRFKWAYLRQRLEYEKQIRSQRMRTEISQVTREVDHYITASEFSDKLKTKMKNNKDTGKPIEKKVPRGFVFTQKLTEDEITNKKEAKTLKNKKYRKLIEKRKVKKKEMKAKKKAQPDELLSSVFVGTGN